MPQASFDVENSHTASVASRVSSKSGVPVSGLLVLLASSVGIGFIVGWHVKSTVLSPMGPFGPEISQLVSPEIKQHAPARALVNLAAIRQNVRLLQASAADMGSRIMAVLKADAYGHGAVAVAKVMETCGIHAFAVATVVEGVELRRGEVRTAKVLVLGAPLPGDLPIYQKHGLDVMVSSLEVASRVQHVMNQMHKGTLKVHLYVETGMARVGLKPGEIHQALEVLSKTRNIKIEGVCTHFAEADDPESHYLEEQLKEFDIAFNIISKHPLGRSREMDVHISNSAALLDVRFHNLLRKCNSSYVRTGAALYGFYPQVASRHTEHTLGEVVSESRRSWIKDLEIHSSMSEPLAEVMTFQAKVTHIAVVEKGTMVGYSRAWAAPERCIIATLGVGYADGYPRAGSNKAQVVLGGLYYPVAGHVCMEMTMINLGSPMGPGQEVQLGDEAVLFGPGGITAGELASQCNTIFVEILAGVKQRVNREYVDNESEVRQTRRISSVLLDEDDDVQ